MQMHGNGTYMHEGNQPKLPYTLSVVNGSDLLAMALLFVIYGVGHSMALDKCIILSILRA